MALRPWRGRPGASPTGASALRIASVSARGTVGPPRGGRDGASAWRTTQRLHRDLVAVHAGGRRIGSLRTWPGAFCFSPRPRYGLARQSLQKDSSMSIAAERLSSLARNKIRARAKHALSATPCQVQRFVRQGTPIPIVWPQRECVRLPRDSQQRHEERFERQLGQTQRRQKSPSSPKRSGTALMAY